jgi:hypothetical protein
MQGGGDATVRKNVVPVQKARLRGARNPLGMHQSRGLFMDIALVALLAVQAAAVPDAVAPEAPATQAVPVIAATAHLPALTVVNLVVLDDLSGKGAVTGQEFDIALATSLMVGGSHVIPAGTRGRGWVVHADKPRFGGKPGELLLAARHLQLGDVQIPLRSMKVGGVGKDNSGLAMGVAVAGGVVGGVASMFIVGKDARVASGLAATAKTAAAMDLPVALLTDAKAVAGAPMIVSTTNSTTSNKE